MRKPLKSLGFLLCMAIFAVFLNVSFSTNDTYAADSRNFNAGRIIDDNIFTNSDSMSVQEIQSFLNSKVSCDTWGTKRSELGGGTRAQWMNARGYSAPFRCVTDYYENSSTGQNNYGQSSTPAGAISAAQIIYNYSKQFNINPQAIIATLQKENGMITDEWPTPKQFSEAMGFGCPDNTAPGAPACDPQYGSFSAQIYQAARHFRGYIDNKPGWWIPFNTGNNQIMWNTVDTGCGAGTVNVENRSTVALYSYTPYQPNQAAKNAQYGYGDGCSAYGNRNFYLWFTDWFGSTYGSVSIVTPLTVKSEFSQGLFTDRTISARFTIKNNSSQRQDLGTMAIGVRDQNNVNFDFGSQQIVLEPWQQYTYEATRNLGAEGQYTFSIINYRSAFGWSSNYPETIGGGTRIVSNAIVQKMPTITLGPVIDNVNLHVNQQTVLRFRVKNNSAIYPVNLGYFGLAITSPTGKNSDIPFDTVTNLTVGATYDYYKNFTPTESGVYSARVSATGDNGTTWSEARYPAAGEGLTNRLNISVKDAVTMTQGLTVDSVNPRTGDVVTGTFKIKNFGNTAAVINKKICYIMRTDKYINNDLGCLEIGTLAAGQEVTYNGSRAVGDPGQYKAYFSMYDGTYWHDNWSFEKETGTEATSLQLTVKSNPTLTGGLSLQNSSLRVGNVINGTFTIENKANSSLVINKKLCFIVRSSKMTNYDLGCLEIGTLQAGEEKTFTGSKKVLDPGQYKAYFSMYDGTYWHDNWSFEKELGSEPTTLQFVVKDSPTLTQGLVGSTQTLSVGATFNGSFKVKNNSSSTLTVNKRLCYIVRDQNFNNNDLGCLEVGTLAAGQELVYTGSKVVTKAGQYKAYFSMYDGKNWNDNWSFEKEVGTEPTTLQFTVQ